MPSASTKIENPPSSEGLDPFKRVLNTLEKKVRNMEKRKQKLDLIIEKRDQGDKLEKDQQAAIEHYDEVEHNLEFARDLQKQFVAINTEVEKMLKKQAKRVMYEKYLQEVKRMKEVLQLQGLLDSMGSDNVRSDFQSGNHGAIVLTEENLHQLDELYKLISPSRDGETDYHEALSKASGHIVNLLDAKDKPVVGTTYKELKELLDLIAQCGYFEKVSESREETKPDDLADDSEYEVVDKHDIPSPDSDEVQASLPPEISEETIPGSSQDSQRLMEEPLDQLSSQQQVTNRPAEADSFFSNPVNTPAVQQQQQQQQTLEQQQQAAAAAFSRQRPFQEIVSSVQGSFNFLQESTIETEAKREFSPHMDPAVVAAHPMPQPSSLGRAPSSQTHDNTPLSTTGFGASSFGEQSQLEKDIQVTSHGASHGSDQMLLSQSNTAQDFTNTGFSQSSITHSLQTEDLFSGAVSASENSAGNITHSVLGKGTSDSTISQFEIPPQIPMPPGHDQSQDSQSNMSAPEKKGYPMNPNASEFQSMIYNQSEDHDEDDTTADNSSYRGSSSYSNNYQNRDQRGGRGGYRGNRGGRGGGNNMTNGFVRGGRNNGNYDRSNSGGGNYQGYQQRNDYRNDRNERNDNYQGYSGGGNNYNNGGYQKRGGNNSGYQSRGGRGGPRGGQGYSNRGGGGGNNYNRGGDNYNRGGGRGFGRPNFNQQQSSH